MPNKDILKNPKNKEIVLKKIEELAPNLQKIDEELRSIGMEIKKLEKYFTYKKDVDLLEKISMALRTAMISPKTYLSQQIYQRVKKS